MSSKEKAAKNIFSYFDNLQEISLAGFMKREQHQRELDRKGIKNFERFKISLNRLMNEGSS